MPAPLPVPNGGQVLIRGAIDGVTCNNVLHFSYTGSPLTTAQANSIAATIRATWVTRFIPLVSVVYTLGNVEVRDLSSDVGVTGVASGSTVGTGTGQNLTSNVALCVSWKTAQHYRGGHGRTYFGGLRTVDITNSHTWASSTITAFSTACAGLITDINGIGSANNSPVFCILRRTAHKSLLTPPMMFAVTAAAIDKRVDSQRRRVGKPF